jgi:RNA polymerase sigma factor (sigma-70 family)
MPDTASILLDNLEAFTRFARTRLGDAELAHDAVQESLLKAIEAARQPDEGQEIPWFYRILRRTIIDLHRRRDARQRAMSRYEANVEGPVDAEETNLLCACYERLLPELPGQYQELLRRVDLEGASPTALARERGVTPNALTVQLHRARTRLRDLLQATCKVCAKHGCLDCDCGEGHGR